MEVDPQWRFQAARFRCHGRFAREPTAVDSPGSGIVLEDPAFRVRAAFLDHQLPCLGYAIEEVSSRSGVVKVSGEMWTARPYDESVVIPAGAKIEVFQIKGATAYVAEVPELDA